MLAFQDEPAKVQISKVTASNDISGSSETTTLAGASMQLTYEGAHDLTGVTGSGDITKSADNKTTPPTSTTSALTLNGLPDGSYTLKETDALAGYAIAADIIFTVQYGEITDVHNPERRAPKRNPA